MTPNNRGKCTYYSNVLPNKRWEKQNKILSKATSFWNLEEPRDFSVFLSRKVSRFSPVHVNKMCSRGIELQKLRECEFRVGLCHFVVIEA